MANLFFFSVLCFVSLACIDVAGGISEEDFDSLAWALRSKGYSIFPDAVLAISDMRMQILDGAAYTLFVPPDTALFALGIASPGFDYVQTLRSHVVPGNLSYSDLRGLPSGSLLPTLLPGCNILVSYDHPETSFLTVDGVKIVDPDIFQGSGVQVHGLEGMMNMTSSSSPEIRRGFTSRADYSASVPSQLTQDPAEDIIDGSDGARPGSLSPGPAGNTEMTPAPSPAWNPPVKFDGWHDAEAVGSCFKDLLRDPHRPSLTIL